jgi:hypothetical protein
LALFCFWHYVFTKDSRKATVSVYLRLPTKAKEENKVSEALLTVTLPHPKFKSLREVHNRLKRICSRALTVINYGSSTLQSHGHFALHYLSEADPALVG